MGTTAEKLQRALDNKNAIKQAIINKGGTVGDNMSEYASAIDNLPSGGSGEISENPLQTLVTGRGAYGGYQLFHRYTGDNVDFIANIDWSANTTCYSMFLHCSNTTAIPQLNTSNVTEMGYMFGYCSNLTTIPQLDTSNVTRMDYMFSYCRNLTTIPQLDTSNVTDTSYMFNNCIKLTSIPQLDTSNVTTCYGMFQSCFKLTTIDITSMDKITSSENTYNFASNCRSLTKLIIRTMTVIPALNSDAFTNCYHFTGTVNSTYNPDGLKDGRIYVPDDFVEQLKSATNWSEYGDIIVPLSTLEE